MDKKSKILLYTFFLLILASTLIIYYKYLVLKDFEVIETETEEISENIDTSTESNGGSETI